MKDRKLVELEATQNILCSRNKLIEDLLTELPLSNEIFKKAKEMRDENFSKDKTFWETAKGENKL